MNFEILTGEVVGPNIIKVEDQDVRCWTNGMEEAVAPQPLDLASYMGKEVAVQGMLHGDLYRANLLTPKGIFNSVVDLYGKATAPELMNDLVAIGTWPTPERPERRQQNVKKHGSVSIDTVPLPERPVALKKLIGALMSACGDEALESIMRS